jgi:alkylhydroperoxidase family enzyme
MSAPHIAPLARRAAVDPELQALLQRCEELGVPDAAFTRILSRVPGYAKALLKAMLVSHTEGNVDHRLKEIIRVQLARTAGDGYFGTLRSAQARAQGLDEARINAGSADFTNDTRFSAAEKWALRYAREMYTNAEYVNVAFYAEGKRHYSEAQIMELGAFIAFHFGMQTWAHTLNLSNGDST